MSLLLLHGALRGRAGNTGAVLDEAARRSPIPVDHLDLSDAPPVEEVVQRLRDATALLVGTGAYWHGWGSPLQRFLEVMTPWENTDCFFGKPVGCVVTMDSVGGADLAARLLHTFNQLGCVVPPCTTLVLSRAAAAAPPDDDTWGLDDLDTVVHNLTAPPAAWRRWPVRALAGPTGAWPASGPLDLRSPRFTPR